MTQQLSLSPLLDVLFEERNRALCLLSPDMGEVRANAEWQRLTGGHPEEERVICPLLDAAGSGHDALERVRAGERVAVPPHRRRLCGEESWWEGSLTPVPMGEGTGILVALHEVEAAGSLPDRKQSAILLGEYMRDMGPAGIVLYEPAPPFRVLAHNRVYQELWPEPFRSRGLVGIPVAEYAPRLEESGILEIFRFVSTSGEIRTLNRFPYDGTAGGTRWYNWTLAPVFRDRVIVALAHMAVDITEEVLARKAAEADHEAARSRAAELQAVLDAVPAAVFITRDRAARTMKSNRYSAALLRVPPGTNVSKTAEEADRPAGFRAMRDGKEIPGPELPIQRAAGRGEYIEGCEFDLLFADGVTRHLVGNAAPLLDAQGEVYGAVGAFLDVTEQKRAQEELRRAHENLRRTLESITAGYYSLDAADRFVAVNHVAAEHFGSSQEHLLGQEIWEVTHAADDCEFRRHFRRAWETGEPAHLERKSLIRPALWLELYLYPRGDVLDVYFCDVTQRKESEEALRKNEERLRLAQTFGGIGVWDCDAATGRAYVEPEFEHLYGVLPGTIQSYHDWVSRVHPEDHRRCQGELEAALRKHAPFEMEFRIVHESGEERWMVSRGSGVYEGDGTLLRVVGINMDITQRKEMEAALRESEEKLRVALHSAQLGTFDYDGVARTLTWDEQTRRMCGIPAQRKADLGLSMQLVHPADRRKVKQALAQAFDSSGSGFYEVEHRIVRPDGSIVWNLGKGQVYFRDDPDRRRAVRLIGVNIDISDLKNAEAAATQSEERFRTLADNIAQFAWMADPGGSIFWYNRRWFDYTGSTIEEMQGWGWEALHHPEHRDRVMAKFRRHLESGELWEDTFPLRGQDGRYRWFLTRALPIRSPEGSIVRWFGTNTDVTEQLEAEGALQEAHRRKDEFLAMLSHELRNPLGPIRNSVYLLRHAEPGSAETARAQQVIERQTDHLTRLVDDLLDVTRIARGKIDLKRCRVDLRSVVQGVVEDFRNIMQQRGIAFQATIPERELVALADRTRLVQVLGNLLHNAAKFTGMGGAVAVELAVNEDAAEICIRDSGRGIDGALLPKIFEIFVQGERTLARSEGGLGLGLALVKGITELHGGTVSAESAGEGKGATFVVRLPLEEMPVPEEAAPAPHAPPPDEKKKILVVDDNPDAADSLASIVRMLGYSVEVAYDGPSAVASALSLRPHLVLCDVGLPGMSGYEVASTLRRTGGSDLVLVAITGYARAEDVETAIAAGFHRHMAKPVYIESLAQIIAELTSRGAAPAPPH